MDDEQGPQLTEGEAEAKLAELRQQHADLDAAIQALALTPVPDLLVIARLKKQKLVLKDQIGRLEDQTTPDIIA